MFSQVCDLLNLKFGHVYEGAAKSNAFLASLGSFKVKLYEEFRVDTLLFMYLMFNACIYTHFNAIFRAFLSFQFKFRHVYDGTTKLYAFLASL